MAKEVLTEQKMEAIRLALGNKTWKSIAKTLNVDERTLWRWRHEDCFRKALVTAQEAVLNEICSGFVENVSISQETLRKMAKNDKREFDTRIQFESAVELYKMSIECKKNLNYFENFRREIELEDESNS